MKVKPSKEQEHSGAVSLTVEEHVPLAPLTTIGIGGPARWFIRAESNETILAADAWARERGIDCFILGGGSNLLIDDDGYDGLVVHVATRGIEEERNGSTVRVTAAAGEPWDGFVAHAVERGLAGIECLSGIPGFVGATPIQNVGAYGQEVSETVVEVEAWDRHEKKIVTIPAAECRFGYRASRFKYDEPDRFVILSVTFELTEGGSPALRYPDLTRALEENGVTSPTLQQVRDVVIAVRKRKGMVLDPNDPDTRSDGSFFMNPIIDESERDDFLAKVRAAGIDPESERVPMFPADGGIKLSAAWLIERAGFNKGLVHGNVGLSSKHSLAIINRGGGTAREVRELVETIQAKVRSTFGVEIHPEPRFIP